MSAFICNHSHVTALAVYAARNRLLNLSDANRIGEMLHAENIKSVNHRYGEATLPAFALCEWAAFHEFSLAQIIKAARCLRYQSCEHPGWEASDACKLLEEIIGQSTTDLPGYDEAEWEITPPATKTYTIKTIIPCNVNFVYRIEAEIEDEAADLFLNSGAEFIREEVGETISFLDHSGFEIEEGDPADRATDYPDELRGTLRKIREAADEYDEMGRDFPMHHLLDIFSLSSSRKACHANATGNVSTDAETNTIRIVVRGGVVQDVAGVPPGWDYEIVDYDSLESEGR